MHPASPWTQATTGIDRRQALLSQGGPHTYSNVQCACRACNIRKGSQSEVGQLPLLAA